MRTSLLLLSILAACGGGDDTGGELSGPPCEQLAQRMCNAARDCSGTDPRCRWEYDQASTLERNCVVCEGGLIDRFCNDTTKTAAMVDACATALDGATCGTNLNAEVVVELPAACDAMMECNDGPCTQ